MTFVTDTALDTLNSYITSTIEVPAALAEARQDAQEFGVTVPDILTGSLLSTLAAGAATPENAAAIAVTPAAGVVGLHILHGLGKEGHLTCIDPETELQAQARTTFRHAGYRPSAVRFLPSRPLEVMNRLAADSYNFIYGEVRPTELKAFFKIAWPLLEEGGVLVLADSLLDGTLADETRKDRDTLAAREIDEYLNLLEDAVVSRLPLGAGMTIVSKRRISQNSDVS
ncbi:O-methyltransferase [Corynebacterium freiburgense]|uniref:O-methyltransferase n=1 Tax=Corynebacterium freiburgense TaxID=556548 RepID=UPI00041631C5|nr:class I SAM-dependent methyltransferase [Corynebacterium freiburgense]WJZ02287.1 Putative O-methyltransferase [Corynebacterium freiburgense]